MDKQNPYSLVYCLKQNVCVKLQLLILMTYFRASISSIVSRMW